MRKMEEDDFFLDDDLDNIPNNTLQALEQNAMSSTQAPQQTTARPVQQLRNQLAGNPNFTRPSTANSNLPWRPPQLIQIQQPSVQNAPPASAPDPPSSDYGFDDEDVVDLDEPSMVIQPASRPQTAGHAQLGPSIAAQTLYGSKDGLDPETKAAFAAADAELGAHRLGQWTGTPSVRPPANGAMDVSALQARIEELEAEQARLQHAEEEARSAALVKQGEIAIVRANHQKTTKEYERRLAVMQKLHADESAKHKADLDAGRKEREKMETDNRFLQHDLAQESERAKRLTGPGNARAAPAGKETPRKAKRTALGDGFDDDEVQVVSPSKSKERPKDQTPKAGAKRKRPVNDSPVTALSFTPPAPLEPQRSAEQPLASGERPDAPSGLLREDERYDFMQRLLNHRPYEGHERSIEALTKHVLPSNPGKSLSSMLMDQLAFSAVMKEEYLPVKLSRILLRLWSYCLVESSYAAFYLILDLLRFAVYIERSSVKSQLVEEAVPLCIRTIESVTVPTVRALVNPTFAASLDAKAHERLTEETDVDEILDLLLDLCQASSLSDERIETFWRNMGFTSTLLMLNKAQPINQIKMALQILATSSLSTTFGTICDDSEKQVKHESDTIDRLTSLLVEHPEVPKDEPTYTEEETAELRIEILNVIKAMCLTDHGGIILSQHRTAIGRLIRFLDGQVNKLYAITPTFGLPAAEDTKPTAHDLVVQTVNMTVLLVYYLLRTYEDTVDFSSKLQVIHGGYHKFLVSMTRVAFSEQLVFEHGIEDEVVEAAHSILDNVLSPEEGEAVVKAVETPRGTKGSYTSGDAREKDISAHVTEIDGDTTMSEPG